jgi:hypothetical protein
VCEEVDISITKLYWKGLHNTDPVWNSGDFFMQYFFGDKSFEMTEDDNDKNNADSGEHFSDEDKFIGTFTLSEWRDVNVRMVLIDDDDGANLSADDVISDSYIGKGNHMGCSILEMKDTHNDGGKFGVTIKTSHDSSCRLDYNPTVGGTCQFTNRFDDP